ncbi:LL-diaminopimelate aminotransferase [Nodosilinea sp. PGN35]|uniref:LL-diaminopimelate aminotransferase n=1 Tax=Nodosilinea sp. PGN35 TaxID=3020489 RepID=UPI0023B308CD|nr:LL-diaminopimelate aminotransferase [Nodosilinea sp. TSF1-S3]MDF0365058.1 LL-diaminopimelate aminotransferase [Nodosilinea sp. TSF1-S3]
MQIAQRMKPLQANVFADMDRAKARARAAGKAVVDLSLGSSDLPTPPHVLDAIAAALDDPTTHGYCLFSGTQAFREAAARWYTDKFGVAVNPDTEVLLLIGSQEGTAHLPLAILNPGDFALLMDPGYPSHAGGVYLANGQIYPMPLHPEDGFLPRFGDIPPAVLEQSRLMVLSYPHNPTTATATLEFWQEAVAFCQRHDLVLAHDFPYADLTFTGQPAVSALQADRDKTCTVEFFTMSKSYNMGGFRVGYAIGNAAIIQALRQVKANVDFNQYPGIQRGAIAALSGPQDTVHQMIATFQTRRDAAVAAFHQVGWAVPVPEATMYIWAKLPEPWGERSQEFCLRLVEQTGVALAPGVGFGKAGEGYVRVALVHPPQVLEEAIARLAKFLPDCSGDRP